MSVSSQLSQYVRRLGRLAVASIWFALAGFPSVAAAQVSVFPSPGSSFNLPATQVSFRGLGVGLIGPVQVVGSVTGPHSGRLEPDSDGLGGSFVPNAPFAPGETVTVTTRLEFVGAPGGSFQFAIADSAGPIPPGKLLLVRDRAGAVQRFRSRPDLRPPALTVSEDSEPAFDGDMFVAPQNGPEQNGPMILDPRGRVVWFDPFPVKRNVLVTDFRVQQLYGRPVLTWWQGNTSFGQGAGEGVVLDRSYRRVATVRAGNGLRMDLHEFLLTPSGDAWIVAGSLARLPGVEQPVLDSVIQEIDVRTGLVLFEWHALDHVPIADTDVPPTPTQVFIDPYHINSIAPEQDGNLLVSMRNTSAVYEIDHESGRVIWTLGGKRSSFKMGAGTSTWGQHDATLEPDGTLTLFDDGAGPPKVHRYSRAIRERLDTAEMTTRLLDQYVHSPRLSARFEGSVQMLGGGEVFLGWGQQPYFSEVSGSGRQDFDAHFDVPTSTYRAYRFAWSGRPLTVPALAVRQNRDGSATLYASWNGATDVDTWRVLAGSSPRRLVPDGLFQKRGFETRIAVSAAARCFEVQALGPDGAVLAGSGPVGG